MPVLLLVGRDTGYVIVDQAGAPVVRGRPHIHRPHIHPSTGLACSVANKQVHQTAHHPVRCGMACGAACHPTAQFKRPRACESGGEGGPQPMVPRRMRMRGPVVRLGLGALLLLHVLCVRAIDPHLLRKATHHPVARGGGAGVAFPRRERLWRAGETSLSPPGGGERRLSTPLSPSSSLCPTPAFRAANPQRTCALSTAPPWLRPIKPSALSCARYSL